MCCSTWTHNACCMGARHGCLSVSGHMQMNGHLGKQGDIWCGNMTSDAIWIRVRHVKAWSNICTCERNKHTQHWGTWAGVFPKQPSVWTITTHLMEAMVTSPKQKMNAYCSEGGIYLDFGLHTWRDRRRNDSHLQVHPHTWRQLSPWHKGERGGWNNSQVSSWGTFLSGQRLPWWECTACGLVPAEVATVTHVVISAAKVHPANSITGLLEFLGTPTEVLSYLVLRINWKKVKP